MEELKMELTNAYDRWNSYSLDLDSDKKILSSKF